MTVRKRRSKRPDNRPKVPSLRRHSTSNRARVTLTCGRTRVTRTFYCGE